MATEVVILKLGMTMTEGTVAEWLVPDGGEVKFGEPIYRLETEKIEMDVEAETAGIVRHVVPEGSLLECGIVVAYILAPGETLTLKADSAARALLLGGEAFATKRHVWWNFVSSSRDRIRQASEDWTARRFPIVPGDEQEWIPIPAVPKTVSYP